MNRLFTSESVTGGHPDKVCDQISDAVLDYLLAHDPMSRVACETVCTTGLVLVMGEITTECYADIPAIVRQTIKDIGYVDAAYGFDYKTCAVLTTLDEQSADIALGVDRSDESKSGRGDDGSLIGAGDQGMMFGYACDETPELMPMPISLAHALAKRLSEARALGELPFLRPDGKTQVTVEYGPDGKPMTCPAIVVSSQHSEDVPMKQLREGIMELVVKKVMPTGLMTREPRVFINPTGRFVIGGPQGDSGLTGRKIIVDTYGGYARHGGGAFSGKDPTKVDRSAAYMARYVAKNIVAAGLAKKCELELAYAIGVAQPVSIYVEADTFGTGVMADERLAGLVRECFDLRPAAIIKNLGLRRPLYKQVAAYGHFGRPELDLPWEKIDKVELLKSKAC